MPLDTTIDEVLRMTLPLHSFYDNNAVREVKLYIVAGSRRSNQPSEKWFAPMDWQISDFGNARMLTATYTQKGQIVHVRSTSTFFGEYIESIRSIFSAYCLLEEELSFRLGYPFKLQPTATMTGRVLLEDRLPDGVEYPALPIAVCRELAANFGQGRFEVLPVSLEKIIDVVRLDGRLMYGSTISHLPVGPMKRDNIAHFEGTWTKKGTLAPIVPGFYNVEATVPENWAHIGLLPFRVRDETIYPRYPGTVFSSWATAEEISLAIENDWDIIIKERILWPSTNIVSDPLAKWRKLLVGIYMGTMSPLVKAGIRSICLSTLGAFNQFSRINQVRMPRQEFINNVSPYFPIRKITRSTSREIEAVVEAPLYSSQQKWIHPEWSKVLWGRGRAKVARKALQFPLENIMAIATDEIFLANCPYILREAIERDDTGEVGQFRIKGTINGPLSWPNNPAEFLRILQEENKK